RVPGCGRNRHVHAHHIQPWAEGGPTRLSNLVLVCSGHHRMIHEGRLKSRICGDKIVFVDAWGRTMPAVAASGATGDDLEELERFLRDADLHIDGSTAPTWDGSRAGIAEALDWLLLAERGCGRFPERPLQSPPLA
ncbi:MAG TPA: HNH endonuclease signature motif containing protein, partial [Enhygromyxa sp.]|nr:HNH endonuclease signature motif containing protein [Enhygromyxa sp.]